MNKITFPYHLTAASIIAYAHSIEAPLQRIGEALIAPSTMPVAFWKIADAPWLDKGKTFLHGSQSFTYKAPLKAGAHLVCELELTKTEKKTGRSRNLILYTHVLTCTCGGERIVTAETVLIDAGDPL
ncbi:FAS1-like dehydratase domain-containing protein [Paenibacillus protaetiae]|uniref:FAS1-like dehydratase domain-containing protein n=1 Tax=Paenibacillus protaetiae TaxID=2509456 RepID=A0A4V0YEY5_9BACL|nr:MaoC family dehydratase N-terminal domain-containing protein [Paenibacillus protaetiae]QAY65831.1 hypothetical protein ET464_04965 [Paenibacillus protaetiae]